jgi:putative ABC transport system permease protein
MGFVRLALSNLTFRPMRTGLTIVGIGLAVVVAVSLIGFNIGYRESIHVSIDKLGFQVMLMAKGCPYEAATMMLKGGTGLLYLPTSTYDEVRNDPQLAAITPIFVGIAEKEVSGIRDDSGAAFIILSGIEQESFVAMKPWLTFAAGPGMDGGRWFTAQATTEIVMGFEVAEFEQRKVGDTFYLTVTPNGEVEPRTHEYKVVGILERTGTQDDGTVFLPLSAARTIFNRPDELTIVGVKLKEFSGVRLREFETRWSKLPEVQVVSLQQVKTTLVSLVETAQTMIAAVAIIAILVAVIGVINTILMSINERTGEIGIMKAIGASRGDIFQLIWLETLFLCIGGGLLGCLGAVLGSRMVEGALRMLIDIGVRGSIVAITAPVLLGALLGAAAVGVLAGLYPAWRAASLRPIEAIRQGE